MTQSTVSTRVRAMLTQVCAMPSRVRAMLWRRGIARCRALWIRLPPKPRGIASVPDFFCAWFNPRSWRGLRFKRRLRALYDALSTREAKWPNWRVPM